VNGAIHGERGTYFNRLGCLSKALGSDLDLVHAIGQAPGIQIALIIRSESMKILVALADELNCGLEAQPGGIGDG
jgi:hypothetical protein